MITPTQRVLLSIIGSHLFGAPMPDLERADWSALLNEAAIQAVFPIVYSTVETSVPDPFRQKALSLHFQFAAKGILNAHQHGDLHRLLSENGIPYVIIKGMASASYYPDPMLRVMGDVDFLVSRDRISQAKDLFLRCGYEFDPDSDQHIHLAFHKPKEELEMHPEPDGIPSGEKGDLCRSFLEDVIEAAEPICIQNETFLAPAPFHHGLIMLLHTAKHMINTGVGLRHLCDWAVFAASLGDDEFKELFSDRLKKVGLWRFAQLLTQLSVRYLGCPERLWAMDDEDPLLLESMMEDVFAAGNFGTKDPSRINEAKLMTTESTGTVDGSGRVFFRALTEKAFLVMPLCKKAKILIPLGWIVVGIRHVFLILRGKRPPVRIRRMIDGAQKRKSIYRQFQLFQ